MKSSNVIDIRCGYLPGIVGRVTELHASYYAKHWQFGQAFEVKVASELAAFVSRYDPARDAILSALRNNRVEGSVTIDGIDATDDGQGAHLRWFILADALRGQGIGRQLLDTALAHSRERGYAAVYLWTFDGLHTARRLYENAGFSLERELAGRQWGTEVTEQRFICRL